MQDLPLIFNSAVSEPKSLYIIVLHSIVISEIATYRVSFISFPLVFLMIYEGRPRTKLF